jgi:hypothetical protein
MCHYCGKIRSNSSGEDNENVKVYQTDGQTDNGRADKLTSDFRSVKLEI